MKPHDTGARARDAGRARVGMLARLIAELQTGPDRSGYERPVRAEDSAAKTVEKSGDAVVTLLFGRDHQGKDFVAIDDAYPTFDQMVDRLHSRAADRDDPNPLPDVLVKFESDGIGIDIGDMHYDPVFGLEVGSRAQTTLWTGDESGAPWREIVQAFLNDLRSEDLIPPSVQP